MPPQAYKAVRRHAPEVVRTSTGPLGAVLRSVTRDVNTVTGSIVWNWNDPFIFDHFSDHVPGMLFVEAALESHTLLTGQEDPGFRMDYHRFGEFNAPVSLTAWVSGEGTSVFTISQLGHQLATGSCCGGVANGHVSASDSTPEGGFERPALHPSC
ncbi:AfsA-related hotdog domain-containing protein [Arthrobacter sp. A5]|uniref:AfsA-related hotdog domain-containing protein n=1 Tax=Arthrobacter sp. A5 TaxID=576926 RepID=UPI003DA9E12C